MAEQQEPFRRGERDIMAEDFGQRGFGLGRMCPAERAGDHKRHEMDRWRSCPIAASMRPGQRFQARR